MTETTPTEAPEWKPSACILCELNCGIEVQLGGDDGRQFLRLRGNRAHPESKGYVCQKAGRLNHYQNSRDRLLSPLRRRSDGTFEEVDWDTAITEVAAKLVELRDGIGGDKIFYFGGGGQGNHLVGGYGAATRKAARSIYRSNALAQEKTGEFWVADRMGTGAARGNFEQCEVGVFLGKNPWQSHGVPRARVVVRELAKDPERCLIVIDPVLTETAEIADIHLRPRPGTDAFLLAAILGVMRDEQLFRNDWIAEHTDGFEEVTGLLSEIDIAAAVEACGVTLEEIQATARRIAAAESVSVFEDLGVQMNRHSTLVSYLQRLVWMLTGNFAREGAHNATSSLVPLANGSTRGPKHTPVGEHRIIAGLTPCNTIPEEILTDHPDRYRAMIVESANPAHSLADSTKMREALEALDFLLVIDVALTETARLADYVLPATTQFEKAEATFFNFDFPHNCFHLRRPLLDPPDGPLPEPEIHARLVEAMGAMPQDAVHELRAALDEGGRLAFARKAQRLMMSRGDVAAAAPVVLYRTLGETLPKGAESGALLWAAAHRCAQSYPESVRRAGIEGEGPLLAEALFDAIIEGVDGIVFTDDPPEESWRRMRSQSGRLQLWIPELADELRGALARPEQVASKEFPFVLSAGERRSFTANTIYRDPTWRRKDAEGALRIAPEDAERLELQTGDVARVTTQAGSAEVVVEVSERMVNGHVSLPNGLGLDYPEENEDPREGRRRRYGVAPNELTSAEHRDPIAGTPWHKSVPARVERADSVAAVGG
ncbi:MAG: molybdopterin-dependent oxidoreductase [Acidobacteriota bacterium]